MEEKIQQEYSRLLEESKVQGKFKKEYADYKTLLNDDLSSVNPKTRAYEGLKELKEKISEYVASITSGQVNVSQLTYSDYNAVSSAVRVALNNVASDPSAKEFSSFMLSIEEPAFAITTKQEHLFEAEATSCLFSYGKGLLCFFKCLKDFLPESDDNKSMTFALYAALSRMVNKFKSKELFYLYEAKIDDNKRLHIEDEYAKFLKGCDVRLRNVIISETNYGQGFNPNILFLTDKIERERLSRLPGLGKKSLSDLERHVIPFLDNVRQILSSEELANLVDGADTWLHRLERQEVKIVPFEIDENLSLACQFEYALKQASQYLSGRDRETQQKYAEKFAGMLEDGMTIEALATSKTPTRLEQILGNFISGKNDGKSTYAGLVFSPTLREKITNVVNENIHHPKEDLMEALGIEREQVFYLLSKAFGFKVEGDEHPIILSNVKSRRNKVAFDKNLKCLKQSLQALLFPATKEVILDDVYERVKQEKGNIEFLPDVILQALENDPNIEEIGEESFQLKKEELGQARLIQGRILYEINDWRTKDEIEKIYWQQFPERKEMFQASQLSNFVSKVSPTMGFIPMGKTGLWRFTDNKTGQEQSVFTLLENLLKDKELVTLDEVMALIKAKNLPYEASTIRAYLLVLCYIDEDGSTFVRLDKKDEYPEYLWKRKYRGDSTNWTVNRSVEILQKQPDYRMAYKLFRDELQRLAKEEGYRPAVINIINAYDGESKLFLRKDGFIELNVHVLENTDLLFEGLYRKEPHFMDIFSYTFNALSHVKDGQLALTELIKGITGQEGMSISESTIRHAFEKDALLPDGLERISVEGKVYVRLVNAKAKDEDEQFKVDNTVPFTNEETPTLVVDTVERPAVTYLTIFTWPELREAMKSELAFYEDWDASNSVISESSLDKFQKFMEGSENSNLRVMIPQDMYDNWFAFTNRFARYHYFTDLALNFEALLVDICRRNGKEVAGKGLGEICNEYYPEYSSVIVKHDISGSRYNKILRNLYINRNQISHGDGKPVEMKSVQMMSSIISYIALYVRTVVKYYKG